MGLIKAALGSLGGVLADQWRECFYCDSLSSDILVAKGRKQNSGRSSNTKGSDNIITNGSVVIVNEGQCMMIVDQGAIVEFTAEPGEFTWNASRERAGSYDRQYTAMQLRKTEGGLTDYLELLAQVKKDHILLFTISGDVYEGFTEDDYWIMVDELGIPEEALEEWYYTGTGTLDLLLMDGKLRLSAYDSEGRDDEIERMIDGWHITFTPGRWYVNGSMAGSVGEGLNVSVYSMLDERMLDYRTFDLTEMYFEEEEE